MSITTTGQPDAEKSLTKPSVQLWPVPPAVGEDPGRGPEADRWPGPADGGQPEACWPAARGQGQEHLQLEVRAQRWAGQEQERDQYDDEDKVYLSSQTIVMF